MHTWEILTVVPFGMRYTHTLATAECLSQLNRSAHNRAAAGGGGGSKTFAHTCTHLQGPAAGQRLTAAA